METNRFIQLRKIFDGAVSLPASEWEGFLQRACGGDAALQAEVRELLLAHLSQGSTEETGGMQSTGLVRNIGPYRILHELGAGGMGVVYLAVRDDGAFRKHVALKLLKRTRAEADLIQRFHQERQVLANLDHPNIARLLDGGQTEDGLPYYVMEYVEGLALDKFCDTQRLDLADRIRLFQQVVSAVQYLHENLVVHRDLKHSNILVTAGGIVKLLDFGIAKTQTPIAESPDLTGPANRLLTPNYASPEQIAGAPVSRASDIYSLGIILYELLTGRLPYADAASKVSGEPPLPSANIREDLQRTPETTAQLRRRIVGDLDQIVLLCLRRDPRHRYPSAAALGEDLRRFLDGRSVIARKEPVIERTLRFLKRNRIAVAVAALILLSGGVGAWKTVEAAILTRQADAKEAAFKRLLDSLYQSISAKPPTGGGQTATGPATSPLVSPARHVDDIRKLRSALEHDLIPAWSIRPGDTPERRALLEQAVRYLDSVRPFAAHDLALAAELAATYKALGVIYEPNSRDHALAAYRNAALMIEGASGGAANIDQGDGQWAFIVARITSLGGMVPEYGPTSSPGETSYTVTIKREKKVPVDQSTPSDPRAELPPTDPGPPQPVNPDEYEAVKRSLDAAIEKGKIADGTMKTIQDSTEALGQAVHPDIRSNYEHMKRALESAQQAMSRGDLASAHDNIGIANECAKRVMKAGGR
ncbi:MAG TPA: serine/threonine-protein kinase [Candidatus Angelobacter sp.]|nr:serine/threonine-protein kinase [Candidatus Angelobacter sp.]